MNIALLILHVVLSLGIITLVLLQKGDGASAGAAFGGGGAGSVFGARGSSNFLSKTTAVLATGFFLNSIALAYLAGHRSVTTDSIMDSLLKPKHVVVTPAPVVKKKIPAKIPAKKQNTDIIPAPDMTKEKPAAAEKTVNRTGNKTHVDKAHNTPSTGIVPPADGAPEK